MFYVFYILQLKGCDYILINCQLKVYVFFILCILKVVIEFNKLQSLKFKFLEFIGCEYLKYTLDRKYL